MKEGGWEFNLTHHFAVFYFKDGTQNQAAN